MNRIDLLPENGLEEAIKQLETDLIEIKNIQYMGFDSLVPKVNQTGNTYDASDLVGVFGLYSISATVTFTADHQPNPFATLVPRVYDAAGNILTIADIGTIAVSVLPVQLPGTYQYVFSLFVSADVPIHIKAYVLATDTGTLDVAVVI